MNQPLKRKYGRGEWIAAGVIVVIGAALIIAMIVSRTAPPKPSEIYKDCPAVWTRPGQPLYPDTLGSSGHYALNDCLKVWLIAETGTWAAVYNPSFHDSLYYVPLDGIIRDPRDLPPLPIRRPAPFVK